MRSRITSQFYVKEERQVEDFELTAKYLLFQQVLGTWSTNYSKRSIGNAFVVNGALYALQWYDAIRSKLNLVYNSRSGQVIRTNIPFTIR